MSLFAGLAALVVVPPPVVPVPVPPLLEPLLLVVPELVPPLLEPLLLVVPELVPPLLEPLLLVVPELVPPLLEPLPLVVPELVPPLLEPLLLVVPELVPPLLEPLLLVVPELVPPLLEPLPPVVPELLPPLVVPVVLPLEPAPSAAVVVAAAADPVSSLPQPASAMVMLPNSAGQTVRPAPNPRLATLNSTPESDSHCRSIRTKSPIRGLPEGTAKPKVAGYSHEAVRVPRQPRCHRLACR